MDFTHWDVSQGRAHRGEEGVRPGDSAQEHCQMQPGGALSSGLVSSGCGTKDHRLGGLNNRNWFLSSGGRKSKIRCQQVWFLLRPLSLPHRWPPSHCVLTRSFLCACTSLVFLCVSKFPPFIRTSVILDYSPSYWPHFNLITSLKTISNHIQKFWGLGFIIWI